MGVIGGASIDYGGTQFIAHPRMTQAVRTVGGTVGGGVGGGGGGGGGPEDGPDGDCCSTSMGENGGGGAGGNAGTDEKKMQRQQQRFAPGGFHVEAVSARLQNSYICNETHFRALRALEESERVGGRLRSVFFIHIPTPSKTVFGSARAREQYEKHFADLESGNNYAPLARAVASVMWSLLDASLDGFPKRVGEKAGERVGEVGEVGEGSGGR